MGKIGITCRQPFLGADEWIQEDLKKASGVERKRRRKERQERRKNRSKERQERRKNRSKERQEKKKK